MNNLIKYQFVGLMLLTLHLEAQEFVKESEAVFSLNSPYPEEFIALHPDGNQLAYSRANHPYNQVGKSDKGDIWIAKFDSIWHTPKNWHLVNDDVFTSPAGWSSDGSTFIYNRVSQKGGRLTTEIRAISGTRRETLDIEYFKNKS